MPKPPPTLNIRDVLKAEMQPVVNLLKDQLVQQLKASAAAEEEARQKLKSDLMEEQQKLQRRVGTMVGNLVEDEARKVAKTVDPFETKGDDSEDEEEEDFSFIQDQSSKRLQPGEDDVRLWLEARRMSEGFAEDDWKKVRVSKLVDFYSGHADAKMFKAMEADPEVGVRYETEKAAEKHSKELEGLAGAAAGAMTNAMTKVMEVSLDIILKTGIPLLFI